jgi:putative PIN family toxin of toxin-antitoxin system
MAIRAVFDCTLFLQAVTSERGPAFKCFQLVEAGRITLFLSPSVLAEVRDVLSRPVIRAQFPILTEDRAAAFVRKFMSVAVIMPDPPNAFALPRDHDDEPYTDLAIAAGAEYLVTWNKRHLTYLMERDTPEGKDFCEKFPSLKILPPPTFIQKIVTQ